MSGIMVKCYFLTDKKITFENDFNVSEKNLGDNFSMYTIEYTKEPNMDYMDKIYDYFIDNDIYCGILFFETTLYIVRENDVFSDSCEIDGYDYSDEIPLKSEYEYSLFGKKNKSSYDLSKFERYINFLPEHIKTKLIIKKEAIK